MALYLTDGTITDIGDALGQNFTEGELSSLSDVLDSAADFLNDLATVPIITFAQDVDVDAEAAQEESNYGQELVTVLKKLAAAVRKGEEAHRG